MAIRGADVDHGRGDYLTVPHTNPADVPAGTVLVVNDIPFVTFGSGLMADVPGNVAYGNGKSTLRGLSDGTISAGGSQVNWNDTTKKFTSGAGKQIGWTLPDQGATSDDDEIEIIYDATGATGV